MEFIVTRTRLLRLPKAFYTMSTAATSMAEFMQQYALLAAIVSELKKVDFCKSHQCIGSQDVGSPGSARTCRMGLLQKIALKMKL
eukprot:2578753-Amphidinium_carterae.2